MQDRVYRVSPGINLRPLTDDLRQFFLMRDHQVQVVPVERGFVVQAAKESTLSTLLGQSSALTVRVAHDGDRLRVEIGTSKWIEKAAVGVVGYVLLAPLVILPIVGAFNQFRLIEEAWERVEMFVARAGAAYAPERPEAPYGTYTPPAGAHACENCGTPMTAGAIFCSRCGAKAAAVPSDPPPAASGAPDCPQCGLLNQPGARFCSGCGHRF